MRRAVLSAILICLLQLVLVSGCERKPAIKLPLGYYPPAKRLTPNDIAAHHPTVGSEKITFAAYVDDIHNGRFPPDVIHMVAGELEKLRVHCGEA